MPALLPVAHIRSQVRMHEGGSNMLVLGTLLHVRNTTRVAIVARMLSDEQAVTLPSQCRYITVNITAHALR